VLDPHGETLVTKFVIERHHHQAADVLKDAIGPTAPLPSHRLMETLVRRPRRDDGSEYEPADFYAGLRYSPLVRKSWFSFAPD
jgi:hypothetical protein